MSKEILKSSLKVSQDQILLNNKQVTPKILASQSNAYFDKHYLDSDNPDHQYEWLEELLFKHRFEGLLSPRDHGKTSHFIRPSIERLTLFNKGLNVLLLSKTSTQSGKTLELIYKDLSTNPKIKSDFQNELKDIRKVKNQLWYNLDPDKPTRDATIEAGGILGDITGGHFKYIFMDDVYDHANTRTEKGRKDILEYIQGTVIPLLEPDGCMIFIGTHKHFNDGYNKLKENPGWKIITQKAILKWPNSWDYVKDGTGTIVDVKNIKGDYEVLWPEKWSIEKLLIQLGVMGRPLFEREFQNKTNQLKGKIMKDRWLKYFAINPDLANENIIAMPPLEEMEIYQGIDLAIGTGANNDYFVITTKGVTYSPYRRYTLDWYVDKISFPKQVKVVRDNFYRPVQPYLIENGIKKWDILKVGIESNAYQKALAEESIELGLPVTEIYSTADKSLRITAGSVNFQNEIEYIPIDHPKLEMFLQQYREFDEGDHEDILDSDNICSRTIISPDLDEEENNEAIFDTIDL